MGICEICGKEETVPFICYYCGKTLCYEHRLPENHDCAAKPKIQPSAVRGDVQNFQRSGGRTLLFKTSKTELLHLTVGIVIFFIVEALRFILYYPSVSVLLVMLVGVISAFLLHELAHKITAQHYRLWSEFRLDPLMAVVSLITAIPWIPIKLIAPGAVLIYGFSVTREQMGKISFAGSLVNLVQAVLFTLLSFYIPQLFFVAILNADLSVFNLIPVSVLDGKKVFDWNKIVWAVAFAASIALWVLLVEM